MRWTLAERLSPVVADRLRAWAARESTTDAHARAIGAVAATITTRQSVHDAFSGRPPMSQTTTDATDGDGANLRASGGVPHRALLLLGVPGTAKTWVSEHLAAAISGDSTLVVQGTAGTPEESLRYGWNYARLLAEGPSRGARAEPGDARHGRRASSRASRS